MISGEGYHTSSYSKLERHRRVKVVKGLKPEEDAFGHIFMACYEGREVFTIVERDDGYIDTLDPKVCLSQYEDWSPIERKAMKHVKGRVLDIGCGAGRHSLYLQKRGFDVLGIDNSPLAVKVSRLRGLKKAKVMSIKDIDFKPNSFDTIIMMGNNFGLFGSFKEARRLLSRFHSMTSESALIIANTRNPYKTDNPFHLEYQKLNKQKGRMAGQVRIRIRFRKYVSTWFDFLMVSKKEMKEILKGTGWKIKESIDSNDAQYIAIIETGAE